MKTLITTILVFDIVAFPVVLGIWVLKGLFDYARAIYYLITDGYYGMYE